MADASRLEELKRQVQRDPASPLFAQLAEEYRRDGQYQEAVRVCRAGLRHHPAYHSARVTLGRSLLGAGELEEAAREFEAVLRASADNIAACRGLGEVYHLDGRTVDALTQFRRALALAPGDADLLSYVEELERSAPLDTAPTPESEAPPPAASEEPSATREEPPATHALAAPDPPKRRLLTHLERWLEAVRADSRP